MTVPAATTTYRYEGNGVTTVFAYSNRLLTTADVKVDILTRATDAFVETLVLTTDYTVTIVSNSLANITITNPAKIPSVTQDLLLTLDLDISQTRSYPRADTLPAADIERGLDKLTLIAQKLDDGQSLTLRFPDSDVAGDGELPSKATRADKYLAFDADGDPVVTTGTDTITSAYGLGLVQSADAASARALLEIESIPFTAASSSAPASLAFAEDIDNGTNKVTVTAPATLAADYVATLPSSTGTLINGALGATDNRLLRADGTAGETAQGSSVSVDDSGNMTNLNSVTFSSTTGIVGTTTNNNAAAGSVGEYIEASLASGSAVTLTSAATANITSISLTAGDWDVNGTLNIVTGASTSVTFITGATSSTSATLPAAPDASRSGQYTAATVPTAVTMSFSGGVKRYSLSATTTVYLVGNVTFTSTAPTAYGIIRARRVR